MGIDPLLGPELLAHLRAMGHGDELVVVDANFPAASVAKRLVRVDGANATQVVSAVLSVFPLDAFAEAAIYVMEVVGGGTLAPITDEFQEIVADRSGQQFCQFARLERFAFYERARQAYVIVATGERRIYGNLILRKGIIQI